jgi:hypothetical protein
MNTIDGMSRVREKKKREDELRARAAERPL